VIKLAYKILSFKIIMKYFLSAFFAFIFLFSASTAFAANPYVSSFTASSQNVNYGYQVVLSWTIENGSGHNLYFSCPNGVSIKKADGSLFPCNTKQSVSANASDNLIFSVINLTGSPIVLAVKVTPKDSSGIEYDSGAAFINLYAGNVPVPIADFSFATTSVATSTFPINLSWTGREISASNLQFDCQNGIQIFSTNPAVNGALNCGIPVYSTDLPGSGSVSVYFVNSNSYTTDQTIRILPAISAGAYDAIHAKSITISIPPKPLPTVPYVSSFESSQKLLASGQSVNFSWVAGNASGVNLQMPCHAFVTWNSVQGSTTTALPCSVPGFSNALPVSGSTTVSFTNISSASQAVPVYLFPQNFSGAYDATKANIVNLIILPPGYVNTNYSANTTLNSQQNILTGTSTSTMASTSALGIKAVRSINFSAYLQFGYRNSQVTALQNFLKLDPSLYPEGSVTGYFGPATLAALKRFQVRYGIAKPGDDGYGLVGPKTRAKLNSLQYF